MRLRVLEEAVPVDLVGDRVVVLAGRIGGLSNLDGSVRLGGLLVHRCRVVGGCPSFRVRGDGAASGMLILRGDARGGRSGVTHPHQRTGQPPERRFHGVVEVLQQRA